MGKNNLKTRLRQGEHILGTMISVVDNPEIAKILKVCGYDFFIVDCEHGSFNFASVAKILAMARECGIAGLVRVPEVRREVVLKFMEMGASGLLLPNTDTPEQARALVEYAKYLPLGKRGVSMLNAHTGYEKVEDPIQYMRDTNADTILMAQVESPLSVKNIDAILDVDGIDAALIGPHDLTQSMGIYTQFGHPDYIAALDRVIASARRKGKFSGIHAMSASSLRPWISKGMTLNLCGNDASFLMDAAKHAAEEIRSIPTSAR